MKPGKGLLSAILIVIAGLVLLAVLGGGDKLKGVQKMRFGIDIRGGVEAIFEPEGIDRKATEDELEAARNVIETRMDGKNITDRDVTIDKKSGYIIVRFPWKSDEKNFNPEDAINELGEMAKLTFRDEEGNILLEGKHVVKSSPQQDNSGTEKNYFVSLEFDAEGARLFEEATGKLVGKSLFIYMDDQEIQSPIVETKISGGKAVIDKMEDFEAARNLSMKINAGALPFSLKTTNFSTISPSLGNNALNVMVVAGAIAFLLVCIFMISMYRLPGVVACFVLVLQTVLQLLAVSIPQYTLTLPGIAGIILSVGMAVDANIIISERITEEIAKSKSFLTAVENGYKNAFSSVLDGNMTTAIVAVILMIFGSGSMLSFGYTLLIGMIVNLLVGVTVSKKMLQCTLTMKCWSKDKFFKPYKMKKQFHFFQKRKVFYSISAVLFSIGILFCVLRGVDLDTQFTGGVVLEYETNKGINIDKVEVAVQKTTERPVTVQIAKDYITKGSSIEVTLAGNGGLSPDKQEEITKAIQKATGKTGVKLAQTFAVEPYIGAKALKNAGIAMILSVIFIIIYVWIRFSGLSAGVTATLALVHDVLIVFFAFVVFGISLNDAFVAVVLTIIGYSINDTIVLYDRIRENSQGKRKDGVVSIVNTSITQTFTRSLNTSITTEICIGVILVASLVFRIESIREFALPMFFGLISGCYSSVCIAGVVWTGWKKRKERVQA